MRQESALRLPTSGAEEELPLRFSCRGEGAIQRRRQMSPLIKCRPSSMPRAFECPSSLEPAYFPVRETSYESDLGQAAHACMAAIVSGGEADMREESRKFEVKIDDLEPMVGYGRKAWREIERYFPGAKTEVPLTSDLGDGTVDLLSQVSESEDSIPSTITIGDWKTGRVQRQYRRQMEAYAYAARQSLGMPKTGCITAVVVWLRFNEIEVIQLRYHDLNRFVLQFFNLAERIGKDYHPGEHCLGCQRSVECKAREEYLRSVHSSLAVAVENGVTREKLAALYPRAKMLEHMLSEYKTALRLALAGGPIEIGGGNQLDLVESHRPMIDPVAARSVLLANGFTADEINSACSMSKTAIEAMAAKRAKHGHKEQMQRAIVSELEAKGALTKATFSRIEKRRVKGE